MKFPWRQRLCLLVCLILHSCGLSLDVFTQARNGSCGRYGKNYFLLLNQTRHRMPDRYTIETYCDRLTWHVTNMNTSQYESYKDGEAITTLWNHHPNLEMIAMAANESYIYEHVTILPFLNPSIVYREKSQAWIVSWRLPDQHSFRGMKCEGSFVMFHKRVLLMIF